MRFSDFRTRVLVLSAALTLFSVSKARAAYFINIDEVGPDVVTTGFGSIDTTDLTFAAANNPVEPGLNPGVSSNISLGPAGPFQPSEVYFGNMSVEEPWGPGTTNFVATSGSGSVVLFICNTPGQAQFDVPPSYVSGSALGTSTDTYAGETFASMGLTPGLYVERWGSGPDADSLTVNIGAVPEPASLGLLAIAMFALPRRRRQ